MYYCIEALRNLTNNHDMVAGNVIGTQTTRHDLVIWLAKWFYARFGYDPHRGWDQYYDLVVRYNNPERDFGIEHENMWQCLYILDIINVRDIHAVEQYNATDPFWMITEKKLASFFCDNVDGMIDIVEEIHKARNPEEAFIDEFSDDSDDSDESEDKAETFMDSVHACLKDDNDELNQSFMRKAFMREMKQEILIGECCTRSKLCGLPILEASLFSNEFSRVFYETIWKVTEAAEDCVDILKALHKEIPLDGSIRQKARAALEEWCDSRQSKKEILVHVYSQLVKSCDQDAD